MTVDLPGAPQLRDLGCGGEGAPSGGVDGLTTADIAEIQLFGTKGYRWVLDANIEACFDSISHTALMIRVRARIKDKRVLALVKAFLKAGLLTELGEQMDTPTAPRQAESCLRCWPTSPCRRSRNTCTGRGSQQGKGATPAWRVVRYADDFVVLVHGDRAHVAICVPAQV
jgi:RNA-directed DNA polymerase